MVKDSLPQVVPKISTADYWYLLSKNVDDGSFLNNFLVNRENFYNEDLLKLFHCFASRTCWPIEAWNWASNPGQSGYAQISESCRVQSLGG